MGASPGICAPLYVDDALLVLQKPAGLLSVPGRGADKQDCLSTRVQQQYPHARVVHRLDMATSGLMLMAQTPLSQRALSDAFAKRQVSKQYIALVQGVIAPSMGDTPDWQLIDLPLRLDWPNRPRSIVDPIGGKPSQTRWRLLHANAATAHSRVLLEPVTGRSHQLRVHLQAIGHPIVGDTLYGTELLQPQASRLHLHATRLVFFHPISGERLQFESPAPF